MKGLAACYPAARLVNTVLPTTKVPDGCIGGPARGLGSRVDGMGLTPLLERYPVDHQD